MKMAVFWDVAPYNLVEVFRRFRGACCVYHRPDGIENLFALYQGELEIHRTNVYLYEL
jgi:hypothetical protein